MGNQSPGCSFFSGFFYEVDYRAPTGCTGKVLSYAEPTARTEYGRVTDLYLLGVPEGHESIHGQPDGWVGQGHNIKYCTSLNLTT